MENKLYKWKVTYTWQCRMSMAKSQGWDANLLSHSVEFKHKTIFSLSFAFNLDLFKCLEVYPKPIANDFPPRLHPFAQQAWLPLLREDLAGPVSSFTSTTSFLILDEDSHCPARPVSLTGSCVIMEKSLFISDGVRPEVQFGLVGRVEGPAWGSGTGRQRPRCSEHALLILQEGSMRFKICVCQKLPVQTKANPDM